VFFIKTASSGSGTTGSLGCFRASGEEETEEVSSHGHRPQVAALEAVGC
jgi:hypothetical protein